jgi:TRAP-type mannitol/chloroaromatic compound transport system permease small subunit
VTAGKAYTGPASEKYAWPDAANAWGVTDASKDRRGAKRWEINVVVLIGWSFLGVSAVPVESAASWIQRLGNHVAWCSVKRVS